MAALALFALPAGAAAKPGSFVSPAERTMNFELPATKGFRITVEATSGRPKEPAQIYIAASRGSRERVQYFAAGTATSDGTIQVKLPRVGRISVRFDPTRVTREPPSGNCKGRDSIVQRGVFRGTIELRGEQGFTRVNRHSVMGSMVQSFRRVCDRRGFEAGEFGPGDSLDSETLFTGLNGKRRENISFAAMRFDFGSKLGGARVTFVASALTQHDGFIAYHSVSVEGGEADFSTPQPAGDVTVTPPGPFHGSALFHLESPQSSSWTGDLGVEIPGVGPVALAGSRFWSVFCTDQKCTDTGPRNDRTVSAGGIIPL